MLNTREFNHHYDSFTSDSATLARTLVAIENLIAAINLLMMNTLS